MQLLIAAALALDVAGAALAQPGELDTWPPHRYLLSAWWTMPHRTYRPESGRFGTEPGSAPTRT